MIININIDMTTWAFVFILSNVSAEESRTGIFRIEPDTLNTRLDGLVFRTFEKISPRLCFNKCIRRPKCHSYNYNRAMLTCELNVKPMSIADFHNKDGYVYVEIDRFRGDSLYDTCLGNHCEEGEVCETLRDGKNVCVQDSCQDQNLKNVAFGKKAEQSWQDTNHIPSNAVDNDLTTYTHTTTEDSPYWEVDLGDYYTIHQIDIFNYKSGGSYLQNLDISVGKTQYDMVVCAHYDGPGTNSEHLVFTMEKKAVGRYVKLNIVGSGRLQFAEIKVFAVPTVSAVC